MPAFHVSPDKLDGKHCSNVRPAGQTSPREMIWPGEEQSETEMLFLARKQTRSTQTSLGNSHTRTRNTALNEQSREMRPERKTTLWTSSSTLALLIRYFVKFLSPLFLASSD